MLLASPSELFPAPPAVSFTLPDGWEPVASAAATVSASDPDSPPGFRANVVVIVSKVLHDHSAEEVGRLLREKTEGDYPGASVVAAAPTEVAGLPAVIATVVFQPADAPMAVAQVQGVVMVPTVAEEVRYAIQFHGTCAHADLDAYEQVFRDGFASLALG